MREVQIASRHIGESHPCFIVAEAGVNHNGDLGIAHRLIDVASEAGADAVKFQTFQADRLVTRNARKATYQKQTTDADESQFDMLQRLELSVEDHRQLMAHCESRDILFLSSPFDEESADLLDELGAVAFKIPSGEITNPFYLAHIAAKHKPMIVSTGMANLGEVEATVELIEKSGNHEFILLHCVTDYPSDPMETNLRAMVTLATAFGKPVGYSDHTIGYEIALAAVALGACIIEKHFTLDKNLPGPDHQASSDPDELAAMVQGIRKIESALGTGRKQPTETERLNASVVRKSLVAACDLPAGTVLSAEMIAIKRPGTGLPPVMRPYVLGRMLKYNVQANSLLQLDMFA